MNAVIKGIVGILLFVIAPPGIAQANGDDELSGSLLWEVSRNGQLTEMYQLRLDNLNDPCPIPKEFRDTVSTSKNSNWLRWDTLSKP